MESADKDFKATVVTIFNEVKENILIINKKIEIFGREMETTKKGNWRTKKIQHMNKVLSIMASTQKIGRS